MNRTTPMIPLLVVACAAAGTLAKPLDPRSILKTYFETGDIPTESNFSNFIDSTISQTPDGVSIMDWAGLIASSSNPQYDNNSLDEMSFMDANIVGMSGQNIHGAYAERTLTVDFSFTNNEGQWVTDESAVFRVLNSPFGFEVGQTLTWTLDAPVTMSFVGDPLAAGRTMTGGTYLETTLQYIPSPGSAGLVAVGLIMARRRR